MKRNIKYLLVLAVVIFLGSCSEDFLTLPLEDRPAADDFYRNADEIRAATASLYGMPWFLFNDKFFWLAGDCMAGNLYYTYTFEGQFFYVSFTPENQFLQEGWTGLFRVISYANSIINDMPSIAEQHVSQDIIDAAVAEARFIRATAYYMLAEFWGDVPIIENSSELVINNEVLLPRSPRSEVYNFIKNDLEFAEENLPGTDPEPGRVTTWAAKGMLAKLYVTMAQSGIDQSANFGLAKQYAQDVIVNSGLTLMEDYYDLFMAENDNNSESLFALQWIAGGWGTGNSRVINWGREGGIFADESWGNGKGCTYDFQQCVEEGDLRRPSIYMTLGDYYPDLNAANGGYTYNFVTPDPDNPENNIENFNDVLNHLKKYIVDRPFVGTNQDGANNSYILRLADLYLIYAEAELGAQSSTSDATTLGYFNAIRSRAGLDALESITFLNILQERRVEFCLESLFWFDIKRYYYRDPNGALNYLNAQTRHYTYERIDWDADANSWDNYELVTDNDPVVVLASDMFLPTPGNEIFAE